MKMEAAYADHSARIPKQPVVMAVCKLAVEFEFVYM